MADRSKELRTKRTIMNGVRGLREQRERAMDEFADALLNVHTFREQTSRAERRAHDLKILARLADNTAAELRNVEELVDEQWQVSLDEEDDPSDVRFDDGHVDAAADTPVADDAGLGTGASDDVANATDDALKSESVDVSPSALGRRMPVAGVTGDGGASRTASDVQTGARAVRAGRGRHGMRVGRGRHPPLGR